MRGGQKKSHLLGLASYRRSRETALTVLDVPLNNFPLDAIVYFYRFYPLKAHSKGRGSIHQTAVQHEVANVPWFLMLGGPCMPATSVSNL